MKGYVNPQLHKGSHLENPNIPGRIPGWHRKSPKGELIKDSKDQRLGRQNSILINNDGVDDLQ